MVAVSPLALKSPVAALPSQSTSRTPCDELTSLTMTSLFTSPSLIPPASESKRTPNTLSSNPSSKSKRRKLDNIVIDPRIDQSMLQCASYALEMISHGGLRSHVIGALVTDGTIQLLYYDCSIFLRSESLNFLEDPSSFVAMLRVMCNLPLLQLGHANLCGETRSMTRKTHPLAQIVEMTPTGFTTVRLKKRMSKKRTSPPVKDLRYGIS